MVSTLIHGDCLEVLTGMPKGCVDLVVADPPYGTTQCKWDSPIDLSRLWPLLRHVVKPGGAVVLTAQTPFDKVLGVSNLTMLKYEWVWEKTNATGFLNAKKMPLKAHENALVFYSRAPTYNPQMTHGHPRRTSVRTEVGSECYGKGGKETRYDSTSRYPRSVLTFPSDKQTSSLHPTQKPVALYEYFIKTYSNPGEVVLDFCFGSCSGGVAAHNTGRAFVGIEKEEKYFNIGRGRLDAVVNKR